MSVNKVILLGNLGAEPEIRYTSGGAPVARMRLATTRSWRDRQTGERKKTTEWHQLVLFDPLSKIVEQYLHKGDKVYIEGSIRTRKWQDQQQQDRYTTEIVVGQMTMLGRRDSDDMPPKETWKSEPTAPSPERSSDQGGQPSSPEGISKEDFVDDIPF